MAYHLVGGTCPIKDWYRDQEIPVRAIFDATLTTLKGTDDWEDRDTKEFKRLTGNHVGLGEIRFRLEKTEQGKKRVRRFRPVGIWPPLNDYEFILLVGCEKQHGVCVPDNAFTLALEYKRRWVEEGEGEVHEYV